MIYGYTLSLDLFNCNTEKFNRKDIQKFLILLCSKIDMKREDLHWWDYDGEDTKDEPDHIVGTSVVQFITTSTIVIHTLDRLEKMYIDLFSCNKFEDNIVLKLVVDFFECEINAIKYYERI